MCGSLSPEVTTTSIEPHDTRSEKQLIDILQTIGLRGPTDTPEATDHGTAELLPTHPHCRPAHTIESSVASILKNPSKSERVSQDVGGEGEWSLESWVRFGISDRLAEAADP